MGIVLEYDAKNKVLRGTLEGIVTDDTLRAAYAAAAQCAAKCGPCRGLWDMSGVTDFEVSSNVIRQLAKDAPIIPAGHMRMVVATTDHQYGMMRMLQMLGETTRPDLHVVRTLDEAYRLLRLESPEFHPVC
ncbi:MAG: hypothetical protein WAU58_18540 [Terriglobales bacterium]